GRGGARAGRRAGGLALLWSAPPAETPPAVPPMMAPPTAHDPHSRLVKFAQPDSARTASPPTRVSTLRMFASSGVSDRGRSNGTQRAVTERVLGVKAHGERGTP